MNKKGFTLVELLAVVVILAIILAIAVPTISSLIDNSRLEVYKNQQGLLKKAALIYLSNNTQLYPTSEGSSIYIKLNDLIASSNISNILDPKDKSVCDVNKSGVKVINSGGNNYIYETYLNCTNYNGDNTVPTIKTTINTNQLTVNASDQRSITFNANGQYTQTNNVVIGTAARTFVFDVDITGATGGYGRWFGSSPMHVPDLATSPTGTFSFAQGNLGTSWVTSGVQVVNAGRKKITYVEKSTGEITVFEGASQIYTGTFTPAALGVFTAFKLGNRYDVNNERMVGRMYEFQLWNKGFSQADVTNNLSAKLTGQESDLTIYYKFDEGNGNQVIDYSNNRNNASVVGASFTPDGSGVKEIRIKQGLTVIATSNQSTYTFTLSAGSYTVEVEDNAGNIATKAVTI